MMAVTETPPGSPLPPDPEAYDSPRAVRAREKGLQAPYIAGGIDPARPMPILPLALLIGALTFNLALCFINTNVVGINDTMVMGCEVVLVATALYLGLGRNAAPYLLLAIFLSYAAMLMAMRPLIDPKAVLYLLGTEMDYRTDKLSAQFVFSNPNQTGACGCGESVNLAPAAPDKLESLRV